MVKEAYLYLQMGMVDCSMEHVVMMSTYHRYTPLESASLLARMLDHDKMSNALV